MMRHLFFLAALALVSAPAVAQDVIAGSDGGFWCSSVDDFSMTVEGKFKDRKDKIGPTCRRITGGETVNVILSEKKEGLIFGIGRFDGRDDMPFVVFQDAAAATPTEKRTFKRVSPDDVRNSPDKWKGRPIEFDRVQVYWIDEGEIRVLTDSSLTLFIGKFVQNDDMKFFAKECETQDEALSPKCRATVRFVYSRHMEDNPTSSMTRTVLISRDAELKRRR